VYLRVVKPFLLEVYHSLCRRLASKRLLEKEMTQKILDSEELDQFIVEYEKEEEADEKELKVDEKELRDVSRKFVGEFREFLQERKLEAERRRVKALHEVLADRLQSAKAELIAKLLDPKSDADIEETPDWCERFVEETYGELDDKVTLKPIKWPDAIRVWEIIKQKNRAKVAEKKIQMRKTRMKNLRDFGELTHDQEDTKSKLPSRCGSGMLISHFSFIAGHETGLLPPEHFSFKMVKNRPVSKSFALKKRKSTILTLHEAVETGRVKITSCSGHSFGKDALHLSIAVIKEGPGPFTVAVQRGTIFQHTD